MSSILKALKKLEQEKALQHEPSGINLSREILKQKQGNRKFVLWLALAAFVALAVIATLTTLLLTKPPLRDEARISPPAAPATTAVALPPAAALIPAAATGTGARPAVAPSPATEVMLKPPSKQVLTPMSLPATDGSSRTELPDRNTLPIETPRTEAAGKQLQPRAAEVAEPAVTLSGIAWNKDSADRLAIINGQPAATGAIISGVLIEEIMPDRVKVNSAGRSFEIFLGKPAKSN